MIDWTTVITTFLTSAGLLTGFFGWFYTRKAVRKQAFLKADEKEMDLFHRNYDWVMQQIDEKDKKIDELYDERHKLWDDIINKNAEITQLRLEKQKLTYERCEIKGCKQRKPPSEYMK